MVDAGEIYHPLRWTPQQAVQFLRDAPALEGAGVVVRMPASWRMNRPARPKVKATVGGKSPSHLGMDALLDFDMEVTLDGETLSAAEVKKLLAQTEGLAFIRGKWVEVDHERLSRTLDHFQAIEQRASADGLSFGEAMRLLAGTAGAEDEASGQAASWSEAVAGPWLAETLAALRNPDRLARADPGAALHGTLRPYQKAGVEWLNLLAQLKLGACLADDMGLGKTIQVLALLLVLKAAAGEKRKPSLLVAPASLLANWSAEIARFAPSLKVVTAHPSAAENERIEAKGEPDLGRVDLVITTYGFLARLPWLKATPWRLAVLDEAQAIKNPAARQTKNVKELRAEARLALTGTPIENRLGDLWSIFDFINPGLLGSAKEFSSFVKSAEDRPENPYGPLRELVRPYILRRMKTDKSIIADLPDKTEVKVFSPLSRRQAALYQETVDDLADRLSGLEGIERRGIVLATLMRLKQICNHPSQWLGDGAWAEDDSGKFARAARNRRSAGRAAGEGAGLHPVQGDDGAAGGVPRLPLRPAGPDPAWRDRGQEAQGPGRAIPGGRRRPVLRDHGQGRRSRIEPDGGLARHPFRSLVESGGGKPGDRPCLPHRPEEERARPQIRLPRHSRG